MNTISGGIKRKFQIVLPKNRNKEVVEEIHSRVEKGHFGINRAVKKIEIENSAAVMRR